MSGIPEAALQRIAEQARQAPPPSDAQIDLLLRLGFGPTRAPKRRRRAAA
jgi:hypothetical protein